jgi:signal peptidase I
MDLEGSQPPAAPTPSPTQTVVEQKQPTELLVREIIETLLLTLFIFWIVNTATGRFRIEGYSMLPTLEEGEYVIINKLSYYLDEPERGDIIVLHFPNDRSRDFIKRVIGLPGDHLEVTDGSVLVNGEALDEPYINAPPNYNGSWDVPEGQYFVLGDNRNNSSDSHNWKFLPRDDIVGKAWIIYWGPDKWGLVPHYSQNIG